MKRFILPLIMFASSVIAGCGGSSSSTEVLVLPDPPTGLAYEAVVPIEGPLAGLVEVVPGSYEITLTKLEGVFAAYQGTMKVKFRFLKPAEIAAGTAYNTFGPDLVGEVLDEKGAKLKFSLDGRVNEELSRFIGRGSGEEWLDFSVTGQGGINNDAEANTMLDMFKSGKKLRFVSKIIEKEESTQSSNTAGDAKEEAPSKTEGSGEDCATLLEGYQQWASSYIEILKKYKKNPKDASILSDYNAMMTEATSWTGKISGCAASTDFAAKFARIQAQIASAASGI